MGATFFLSGWGLGFTAYVVVQVLALLALRTTRRRRIALFPAPVMLGVLLWTLYAYQVESNLWPIVMIVASPMAAIAVIALWITMWLEARRDFATNSNRHSGLP